MQKKILAILLISVFVILLLNGEFFQIGGKSIAGLYLLMAILLGIVFYISKKSHRNNQ